MPNLNFLIKKLFWTGGREGEGDLKRNMASKIIQDVINLVTKLSFFINIHGINTKYNNINLFNINANNYAQSNFSRDLASKSNLLIL